MNYNNFDGWDWTELAVAWNIYIPFSYAGKDMYAFCEKMRLNPELRKQTSKYTVLHEDGTEEEKQWSDLFPEIDYSVNEYENFDEFDPVVWYIQTALRVSWGKDPNNVSRVVRKMANDVRCFAKKLAKSKHSYYTPLWLGLSRIKHDEVVLRVISTPSPLIGAMWD